MVQGFGKEMGQPNGVATVAFYLGHGEVDAAASTPSWRCPGEIGARERSREWRGVSREARGGLNSAGAAYRG